MTVSVQEPIIQHTANGATTVFAYNFLVLDSADFEVYLDDILQTSGFTVSGIGINTGGTVTFAVAPASGVVVTLLRSVDLKRDTDYQNAGDFRATTVNPDFDRIWMALQQLQRQLDRRALLFPQTEVRPPALNVLPSPVDGQIMSWSSGQLINTPITSIADDLSFANSAQVFASVATMKASFNPSISSYARTAGYVSKELGGAGLYAWESASVAVDDGFLVHSVTGFATGRLKLIPYNDVYTLLQAGAYNDGTNSASTNAAIARIQAVQTTIKSVFVPSGVYLCSGFLITVDYFGVVFAPNVTLKAAADSIVFFWQAASWAKNSGRFKADSNGKANVWGVVCGPQSLTQTTTLTQNNHNKLPGAIGDSGVVELYVFQCGPDVGGADSGCFYNTVPFVRGEGCKRVMWFKDPPNAGGASPNRNEVYDFRVGTGGGVASNTGIQIDAGDTNTFYGADFEGVSGGTSPNAIPTGLIVKNASAVSGADNNSNKFIGGTYEACTRDIELHNPRTDFICHGYTDSKCLFVAQPLVSIGGQDASQLDQRALGLKQIDGASLELNDIADFSDTGKKWQSYPLTTANVIHVGGAAVTSVVESQSKFWQLSGMVFWSFRVQFRAANTNAIRITLPVPEEINQYSLNSLIPPMRFFAVVNDGVTEISAIANFVTGADAIEVNHSGLWDTAGANNSIHVSYFMYHKA